MLAAILCALAFADPLPVAPPLGLPTAPALFGASSVRVEAPELRPVLLASRVETTAASEAEPCPCVRGECPCSKTSKPATVAPFPAIDKPNWVWVVGWERYVWGTVNARGEIVPITPQPAPPFQQVPRSPYAYRAGSACSSGRCPR